MATDIVLFLRDRIPHGKLVDALSRLFGLDHQEDGPLIVDYTEGFATGVGIAVNSETSIRDMASELARQLCTEVLLEVNQAGMGSSDWLLFYPDSPRAMPAQLVELRHGLTATVQKRKTAIGARAVYA
ncbi:MAG TPA: hypothetical protein VEC35_01780 [Noviherbaspirillum sp.]|nr:hypothetical protein [Noviherbaspirillum sp.]